MTVHSDPPSSAADAASVFDHDTCAVFGVSVFVKTQVILPEPVVRPARFTPPSTIVCDTKAPPPCRHCTPLSVHPVWACSASRTVAVSPLGCEKDSVQFAVPAASAVVVCVGVPERETPFGPAAFVPVKLQPPTFVVVTPAADTVVLLTSIGIWQVASLTISLSCFLRSVQFDVWK